jgi:hypothetical protein
MDGSLDSNELSTPLVSVVPESEESADDDVLEKKKSEKN